MKVWITKRLKEIFLKETSEDIVCIDTEFFQIEYIKKAGIIDIAVLELSNDYLEFLNNKKLKGIEGITIFCDFRKNIVEDLTNYGALILNVSKIGLEETKEILKFLINSQKEKYQPFLWYHVNEINIPKQPRDFPVCSKEEIVEIVEYPFKKKQSIIISFGVDENGKKVTARGTANIKDIRQNYFVLEKIKPPFIINGLKDDQLLKVIFPSSKLHYEGLCILRVKKEDMLYLDFPEKIFIERRRHLRVEPSNKKPVSIFVHIPDQDSQPFEVLDISLQGVAFVSERDLLIDGIYTFVIWIRDTDNIIISTGIIRYKQALENYYKYGVEFQLTEKDKDKIANYIQKREIEILENLKEASTT